MLSRLDIWTLSQKVAQLWPIILLHLVVSTLKPVRSDVFIYKCVIILDPSFPHHLADLGALPAKMFPELLLDNQESQHREGTRTYVRYLKWTARYCSLLTCNLSKTQLMNIRYLIFYKSMNVLEPLELVLEERIKQKSMEFTF